MRRLVAALAAIFAMSARAGDYARDPCAIPGGLDRHAAALAARYDGLVAASKQLDAQGRSHDDQCARDLPLGSPAEVACRGNKQKLMSALSAHDQSVERYRKEVLNLIEESLAALETRMTQTRSRLLAVAPAADAWTREMGEWIQLGEDARREARWTAYEKTTGLALTAIKGSIDLQLSLSEDARAKFGAWLAAAGSALPSGSRSVIEAQIRNLRTGRDVIALLEYLYDQHTRAYSVARAAEAGRGWEASGQALTGALKLSLSLMQGTSPQSKLAVDISELLVDGGYGWLARISAERRVEQFAAVQEANLRAVKALTRFYAGDVTARRELTAARQKLQSEACR